MRRLLLEGVIKGHTKGRESDASGKSTREAAPTERSFGNDHRSSNPAAKFGDHFSEGI